MILGSPLVGLASLALVCAAKVQCVPRALPKCVASTFAGVLPSGARIETVARVSEGGTYNEGTANLGYPSPPYTPTQLPELCVVVVNVTSSPTSNYRFGLYLPTTWNSKFLAVGNGGFAGGINWYDMAPGTRYGFASLSTDTGHNSAVGQLDWALRSPERRADWGWRAVHGSADMGKKLTAAYYGRKPAYAYWNGCSTGGRQGLKEIQISPSTFDGALIGAPAWDTMHMNPAVTRLATFNLPASDPKHIPPSLFLGAYADFVRAQCDGADGVRDGIVSSPELCALDLAKIRCGGPGVNASACLTDAQIRTANNIYSDYRDAAGRYLHSGFSKGSERQWDVYFGGSGPSPFGDGYVRFFLYDDPFWTWQQYNDSVAHDAERLDPGDATADLYDLSAFRARGGKIFMYHGTADAIVPPRASSLYYERVSAATGAGGDPRDFFRYFEVPGAAHCYSTAQDAPWAFAGAFQAGITGTAQWSVPGFRDARHDALMALMDWVERGKPIEQVVATTWTRPTDVTSGVLRQRPLCPWPKKAALKGGDEKVASNWACK